MKEMKLSELLNQEKAVYIHPKNKDAAIRFLQDAEHEGFLFDNGKKPTEKDTADLFRLLPNKRICYTGHTGHIAFQAGGDNVIRIEWA